MSRIDLLKTNKLDTSGGVPSVKKWQTGLFTGLNIYCSPSHLTAKLTKHICDIYNSSEKVQLQLYSSMNLSSLRSKRTLWNQLSFVSVGECDPPGPPASDRAFRRSEIMGIIGCL